MEIPSHFTSEWNDGSGKVEVGSVNNNEAGSIKIIFFGSKGQAN